MDSLNSAELDAVMVHELLHVALLHLPRRGGRDPRLWNVAADIVVNGIIRRQDGLTLPPNPCIDPKLEDYEVEEIYETLLSRRPERPITWIGEDLLTGENRGCLTEMERRALEAHWKQAWQQAATIAQTLGQGSLPEEMRRHLDAIADPKLDWRSLLWRFLVRTPVDFTEFDRRLIGCGIYLEALAGESVSVRIAVDTSGSITPYDLAQFIGEVCEILRLYPQIDAQLYYADAALHGPFDLNDDALATPVGGGGTSFVPFFTHMRGEGDVCENVVLIYFTDGYGAFPKDAPAQPVLWVVVPGGLVSSRFPFGTVARFLGKSLKP